MEAEVQEEAEVELEDIKTMPRALSRHRHTLLLSEVAGQEQLQEEMAQMVIIPYLIQAELQLQETEEEEERDG